MRPSSVLALGLWSPLPPPSSLYPRAAHLRVGWVVNSIVIISIINAKEEVFLVLILRTGLIGTLLVFFKVVSNIGKIHIDLDNV